MVMADTNASSSTSQRSASRLVLSMKRSLSQSVPKKRLSEYSKNGMHSTSEETSATSSSPQQFREADPASSRPTIEQIAMGLHTSRTPHLRPLASSSYTFSQRHPAPHSPNPYEHKTTSGPLTLPPPPTRSSMKKKTSPSATSSSGSPAISPPFSTTSATSTTLTSLTPSTHSPRSFAGLKSRMARFLPHARSTSLPVSLVSSPLSSPRSSSCDSSQPKKAVRFTTEEVVDGE